MMAPGRRIAPSEGIPTVRTVGRLADVQLIYGCHWSERAGTPRVAGLPAARAGTQLPDFYPCAAGRITGRRLMRIGRSLVELRLKSLDLRLQSNHLCL